MGIWLRCCFAIFIEWMKKRERTNEKKNPIAFGFLGLFTNLIYVVLYVVYTYEAYLDAVWYVYVCVCICVESTLGAFSFFSKTEVTRNETKRTECQALRRAWQIENTVKRDTRAHTNTHAAKKNTHKPRWNEHIDYVTIFEKVLQRAREIKSWVHACIRYMYKTHTTLLQN